MHARQIEQLIETKLTEAHNPTMVTIDLSAIQRLDTYGAWLIERFSRQWQSRSIDLQWDVIPERFKDLINAVQNTNQVSVDKSVPKGNLSAGLGTIGQTVVEFWSDLSAYAQTLGELAASAGRLSKRPANFRLTSAVHQLDRVGWQAIPIIVLITGLIGGIIAQQGIFHFRKFGADMYVVDMVGILIVREIGVLIVAIMVAGRSGSSYTAELGSMKMREEIDALRTMGLRPIDVLILPRVTALILSLTALTFLGSMAALFGGGLVSWFYGDMHPDVFMARLREVLTITHFKVGIIKAPFMALVIGIVACTHGLRVKGSADSLGQETTESVVKSIFLVIVLDGFFAVFFAAIGM